MDKKRFASLTLKAAALYNILWGTWVILRPNDLFVFAEMPPPNYPSIWQCVGMIVGVYGVGYWLAAKDPWRHWPIVFVGLLGKILGPIGFVDAVLNNVYDIRFGYIILTNDLIWWLPFGFILWHSYIESED